VLTVIDIKIGLLLAWKTWCVALIIECSTKTGADEG